MSASYTPKRVLIAPLDWGLGHATRCVPIINAFMERGHDVQIASSGKALTLLKMEFPTLTFHELVSYNVHYAKNFPLSVSLLVQVPKFLKRIKEEHRQLEKIVTDQKIDLVISDNRYGCWTNQARCVFITHQVNILMPVALKWIGLVINHFNHRQIRKFYSCWVPDEEQNRITGILSESMGLKVRYIGMLSRFIKSATVATKYDVLVLISGPEPQRTLLEQQMLKKLAGLHGRIMLVRGIPENEGSVEESGESMILRNHLKTRELNQIMEESEIIISRSGYSTIMDLAKLNKKAILIPTPGQTEQVYLAEQLKKRKIAFISSLEELDVNKAIEFSSEYTGFIDENKNDLLNKAINELLS